jgi:glycosyltransferase involved in cell wall biosynthesis
LTPITFDDVESKPVIHQPLLSVIIPVYNGSEKIGPTLANLQQKIGQIEPVMWDVEFQRSKREHAILRGEPISEGVSAPIEQKESLTVLTSGAAKAQDEVRIPSKSDWSDARSAAPSTTLSEWYEIIVVNDGSKDSTKSVLERIAQNEERLRLISYSPNMGKGFAIKQGVSHSSGKYILFMDGDGDIDANVVSNYLRRLSEVDIVIGSKHHPSSVVRAPFSRKILSRCFQTFVRVILNLKFRDTQVGLKVGRGDLFRKIFDKITVKRYAFDAEMLVIADLLEAKVLELPVKIDLDKSFKMKEMAKMALDVFGVAYRMRVKKSYQKNFTKDASIAN